MASVTPYGSPDYYYNDDHIHRKSDDVLVGYIVNNNEYSFRKGEEFWYEGFYGIPTDTQVEMAIKQFCRYVTETGDCSGMSGFMGGGINHIKFADPEVVALLIKNNFDFHKGYTDHGCYSLNFIEWLGFMHYEMFYDFDTDYSILESRGTIRETINQTAELFFDGLRLLDENGILQDNTEYYYPNLVTMYFMTK